MLILHVHAVVEEHGVLNADLSMQRVTNSRNQSQISSRRYSDASGDVGGSRPLITDDPNYCRRRDVLPCLTCLTCL